MAHDRVAREGIEPHRQAERVPQRADAVEDLEPNFLEDLRGVFLVRHEPPDVEEEFPLPGSDQPLECLPVSALTAKYEDLDLDGLAVLVQCETPLPGLFSSRGTRQAGSWRVRIFVVSANAPLPEWLGRVGSGGRRRSTLSLGEWSQGPEFARLHLPILRPDVIPGQVDVLPAQRREVLEQGLIHGLAVLPDRANRPLQIDRVPEHDGRRHQIQAAGAVALVLEAPVAHLAQAIEEHGPGQGVSGLALVEPSLDAAAQFDVLQPVEGEQAAFNPPQLAQRHGQAVLARVAAEFPEHQRGGHRTLPDGGRQTQDFIPMGADGLGIDPAPDERRERRVITGLAGDEQPLVGQVADAWREAKPEQVHQREDVVGEARRVRVVLLDAQIRLVVEQTVEHVGGIAHADVDDLGMERGVLVGDVGVEQHAGLAAVLRVDVAASLRMPPGLEALAVR